MNALNNLRHELFAQGLAKGQSQEKAYKAAGYAPRSARQGACKLLQRNADISQRVEELLQQRRTADGHAVTAAATELAIDKEWILSRLVAVYEAGVRAKKDGASENLGAANRALELIGKQLGMFVDRRDVHRGSIEDWLARYCSDDSAGAFGSVIQQKN